ncbi:MAG: hypothetical protein PWR01_2966 [Clostridiales bacterium]|nr:hypothetical protein [Clostridiales bacterium]MDN5281893.1 hypothetical protein [Candidatus Ozemobacter sp.]
MISRKVTFIFVLAISLFCAVQQIEAADKKPAFGFTNVSKAMMLHPLMAKFKIKEGRFVPDAVKSKTGKDIDKARSALEKKRQVLVAKQKKLEENLEKIDKEFSKALASLNVKFNSKKKDSSPDKPSNQYNREKNQLESTYWVKRRGLQQQISLTKEEIQKLNEENSLMHLSSQEETAQIFKLMVDDIYEAIDVVANHYKVDFVFNSSFTIERTAVNPAFTPVNPMGDFFASEYNRDAAEVLYKHGEDGQAPLYMTLEYWCACQRWAFRNLIDPRIDKLILKGGLDMTPAVIDFVYQKYKVPGGHRDIIQEFLKKQSN